MCVSVCAQRILCLFSLNVASVFGMACRLPKNRSNPEEYGTAYWSIPLGTLPHRSFRCSTNAKQNLNNCSRTSAMHLHKQLSQTMMEVPVKFVLPSKPFSFSLSLILRSNNFFSDSCYACSPCCFHVFPGLFLSRCLFTILYFIQSLSCSFQFKLNRIIEFVCDAFV